uniref:HIT-type domain-containing protein n=1 Tax=Homalodisca liturata TaxID=320908 RepID=A0A1B6J203_9HEMI
MDTKNPCKMCLQIEAKYVCPRCNIPYCSLSCYQSESHVQCSESFYRDCVVEQIRGDQLDSESQQKMVEMLQRVQQIDTQFQDEEALDSDDSDSCAELSDRLAGVDLDNADSVWERLTEDERQQFHQFVTSGDIGELLPEWTPWWTYREKKELVKELNVSSSVEEESELASHCPSIKQDIQLLSKLSKMTPSPMVRWNVVNVLAAYAVTARVYNGDFQSSPQSAAVMLITISENLAINQVFDNPELAVTSVQMAAINYGCFLDGVEGTTLKEDVKMLVEGPSESRQNQHVLAALSHIHSILTDAKRIMKETTKSKSTGEFSKRFPQPETKSVSSKDLSKHLKKIDFYLSWAKEYF